MAHDVWLLRGFVVVCFFLCVLTGVETFPVKTNLHHVWPEVKHEGNLTHEESTAVLPHRESRNKWLTGGHVTLQTKRGDKGKTGKTRTIRSRIQILDKYYVNPDKVKRKVTKESSLKGDNEQSALLLKDPELTTHSNKFMDSALREVPFYTDINSVNSVEGSAIVNIASLLEKSRKSQAVKRNNVGRIPASSRYHSLRQESTEHPGWMSMTPSRFRYLNSLIKPQMGEISDDLNDLEALRNHAKDVKARAWSSGLKSFQQKLYGQLWDERSETVKNAKKRAKSTSYTVKEQSDEGASNTETENAAGYRSSDLFLLGNPDDRHYFQSAFMENPMAINLITAGSAQDEPFQNKGSIVRPTTPWKMNGATVPLREEEILGKFQGESETTETASLSSGDDSYSGENSDDLNRKLKTALGLAIQTDIRIKNTTSHALPQPYREKALSHIEEESDDMYNETKGNGSIEDKKVNPLQHFRPTKKRHFTKPTSLITNRRTTIPFPKLGLAHDTSAHGSGGESGSGDHFVSAHEHHQKQVHPHRITKVFLSTKTKQHTGIFGAEDKATITKCEKMGKTDYRERCPHGWLAFDEFCYLFVSKSNGRWEEFPQKCNKENGLLAMPKTDGEVQFLQNKIVSLKHRTKNFYIGLRKKGGIWTWIDDVPYTRDVDVKDELGNKNCAALFEGSINMVSCREPKAGYICEIRKGVRVLPILAFGDSLTNGFHADDLSHTPYGNTLEFLLNKDQHRCYTVTTVAKDGTEAAEMSSRLQDHLKRAKSKYSWIIILAGTNDIAHNSHDRNRRAWDKAAEHIINLHITSHRYGAKTVAVTIPEMDCEESKRPPCLHTHLERRYINEKLRYYARSNEFTILCDLADKFPRYSLSSEERKQMWEVGLHMKSAGYERMAEIIYKDLLAHV